MTPDLRRKYYLGWQFQGVICRVASPQGIQPRCHAVQVPRCHAARCHAMQVPRCHMPAPHPRVSGHVLAHVHHSVELLGALVVETTHGADLSTFDHCSELCGGACALCFPLNP